MKAAKYLGKLPNGKKVYRVPVKVILNDSRKHRTWGKEPEEWHQVHASSISDAANLIRDLYKFRPETDIVAFGRIDPSSWLRQGRGARRDRQPSN